MDTKRELKEILDTKGTKLASLVIYGLIFALILAALIAYNTFLPFSGTIDASSKNGDSGTLKLQWLDYGFAEDDELVYCTARGQDGYEYVVAFRKNGYEEKYKEWIEYYPEENVTVSENPLRIAGAMDTMPDELIAFGAEFTELSEEEFVTYFGTVYLDTTTSGNSFVNTMLILIAFIGGFFFLCFLISFCIEKSNEKKTIQKLENTGELDRVVSELASALNVTLANGTLIFTEHYFVLVGAKKVLRYDDLLWAYVTVQKTNFKPTGQYLTIKTANRETLSVAFDKPNKKETGITRAVMEELATRCPDILLGHTTENAIEYTHRLDGKFTPMA